MRHLPAFLSLFTSVGTLFCCAIPAAFILLGAGATFASITNTVPQIIWIGEHKGWVFTLGGSFLSIGLILPYFFPPPVKCDLDGNPCEQTRSWSQPLLYGSIILYTIGVFFAYIAPLMM